MPSRRPRTWNVSRNLGHAFEAGRDHLDHGNANLGPREVDHDGSGLSLTGGGKKVELTDFVIDPGRSLLTGKVTVDGAVAAESAPLFFLDGRTLKPLQTGEGTAILEGTTVKLKQEAADLLNQTFGVDALAGGFKIGVARITVNTA